MPPRTPPTLITPNLTLTLLPDVRHKHLATLALVMLRVVPSHAARQILKVEKRVICAIWDGPSVSTFDRRRIPFAVVACD